MTLSSGFRCCWCYIWIVTLPSQFALVSKILLHWVMVETLCKHKLRPFLEQEFGCLNCRIHCFLEALVSLPGKEHTGSGILAEVSWPVVCALLQSPQILQPETKWKPKMLVTPRSLGCQHWVHKKCYPLF